MSNFKKSALYVWDHFEEIILVPSLVFSVLLLFIQIVMRYVFNNSIYWSEELARYLFVWQCWLGIAYSTKKGTHLRITMIHNALSKKASNCLEIFVMLVWMAFSVFLIFRGFGLTTMIGNYGQISAAMHLPMEYIYASIPVGAALMLIRLIEVFIKQFVLKAGPAAAVNPEAEVTAK